MDWNYHQVTVYLFFKIIYSLSQGFSTHTCITIISIQLAYIAYSMSLAAISASLCKFRWSQTNNQPIKWQFPKSANVTKVIYALLWFGFCEDNAFLNSKSSIEKKSPFRFIATILTCIMKSVTVKESLVCCVKVWKKSLFGIKIWRGDLRVASNNEHRFIIHKNTF